ncbi:MAK10-like protein [Tanacetum coccineum]
MFQQHQGESLSEAWTRFKDLLQKVPHHGFDLWLQVQIFYNPVNPATRRTIDQSAGGKLRDKNAKESWALLVDLAYYDNESWNDPRDFVKPVKVISLAQDVRSTFDRRLIKLENQFQHLMEAHLAPKLPIQVNKIASSCKICSGPHDTQYCMENPEQAFVDYASLRNNKVGGQGESRDIKRDDPDDRACGDTKEAGGVNEESEESEKEAEEEEEDDPEYFDTPHEWLLKNPRPPWVNAKSRRKLSNPEKISNFVGRVRGLKVFVGNNQVKDNKIDLLVQQYEQFFISEDESIDCAFARFNTIITSLKALDEGYSSKNYVRKFLRALHPKLRAKVMAIKESKDLTSLSPYELLRGMKPNLDYFRVFGRKCFILNTKDYLTKFDSKSYEGVFLGYSQNSKAYIILNKHTRKIEESLNVTFDETPPPSKTSPLVDDDLDEEEAIKVTEKKNLENDIEDETLEINEIVNIKESRNHPLENVIGNLNQT